MSGIRALAALAAGVALAAGLGGCALFRSDDAPQWFTVEESTLNGLDIYYTPGMGQPITHLELMGSGHFRIKHGSSPLLTDAFSQDVKNRRWSDLSVDQTTIDPAEMRCVFQSFVDRGLMRQKPAPDFAGAAERGAPFARVTGTISNTIVSREVAEPELLSLIGELIKAFEHPND